MVTENNNRQGEAPLQTTRPNRGRRPIGVGDKARARPTAAGAAGAVVAGSAETSPHDGQAGETPETAPGFPEFERLFAKAGELGVGDHDGARQVLIEARHAKLPDGETAILRAALADATDLTSAIISNLYRDAARHHPKYGFLATTSDLGAALGEELTGEDGNATFADGGLWRYPPSVDISDERRWSLVQTEKLEAELLAKFPGHPLVEKTSDRREIIKRLCLLCAEPHDFFDRAELGVNLANGFLQFDGDTGEVRLVEHAQEHAARFLLPVHFEAEAQAPTFMAGIQRIMGGDAAKVRCFLQFVACVLFGILPARDPVRTVMILYGPPRTGKSTLIRLLQRLVPDYAQASIPPELWSDERHRAKFRGVLLNTVTELSAGSSRAISGHHFKLVASHEPVTAREVYRQSVTFTPRALHVFACNQLPTVSDRDTSIHRRLIVLRVGETISEDELSETFLEDCWAEAPGIVRLLGNIAGELSREGRFSLPADNMDHILQMQFRDRPEELLARLGIEAAPGARITSVELQAALRKMADDLGIETSYWGPGKGMAALSARLGDLYGSVRRAVGGKPFYDGIRFRPGYGPVSDAEDPDTAGGVAAEVDIADL